MKKALRFLGWAVTGLLAVAAATAAVFYEPDLPFDDLKAKYATGASRFVNVGGLPVHYRDEGPAADSLPLVLLHGTGASLLTWEGWARALRTTHRVVRLDVPGYGLTGPNASHDYSPEAYTRFLNEFFRKTGIARCHLGGNSLGGGIAWRYALAHPERVRSLVLVDAAGYPLPPKETPLAFRLARVPGLRRLLTNVTPRFVVAQSVRQVYADPRRVSDSLVGQYFDLARRAGNRAAFIRRMQHPVADSAWRRIPTLTMPALVLWGAHDRLIPVENAHRFHGDLPHDTLVIFPDAGHVPMEERPAETARVVREFLTRPTDKDRVASDRVAGAAQQAHARREENQAQHQPHPGGAGHAALHEIHGGVNQATQAEHGQQDRENAFNVHDEVK